MKKTLSYVLAAATAASMFCVPASVNAEETKTIHFLTCWNEDKDTTQVIKQLTDEYNESNPEIPINLEIEVVAQSDMNQKLSVLAASNDLPDVFVTGTQEYIAEYVEQGILKNVDDIIEEQGITSISEEDRASILNLTKQDGLYVLPTNKNIEGFWYNKKIFADNGLEVPETMDEFMDVCAKLKEAGIQPVACAGKEQWPITRLMGGYATQAGGTELLVQANNGDISWSDPAFLEAYQWLIDMGNNGYFGEGVTTVDTDTQNSLFITGAAAMEYNGSWFTENLSSTQNTLGEEVGFFAFPTVEGGQGVANTYTTSYGMFICLKDETYDEATGAWIAYVMEHFGDKGMELHGWLTPYAMQEEHEIGFFTQMMIDATENEGAASVWPEYAMPTMIQDVEYQNAQLLVLGQMTAEAFGQAMDDAMTMNGMFN